MTEHTNDTAKHSSETTRPRIIAIPTRHPGGLDARLGIHFGRSECITIVTLREGAEPLVQAVDNREHRGVVGIIDLLRQHCVEAIAARHIGHRPLAALVAAGFPVYEANGNSARDAIAELEAGSMRLLTAGDSCREDSPVTGRGGAHGQHTVPGHGRGRGNDAGFGERCGHGGGGRR
jgi:predicted Fe-Mo cluster-binding NifX family protein